MISSDNNPTDNREIQIEMAEALHRLLENPDFAKVFQENFIEAFAITNIYNNWTYDDAARRRYLEKSMARGEFSRFIDMTLEDGRSALTSFKEEQDELAEGEI